MSSLVECDDMRAGRSAHQEIKDLRRGDPIQGICNPASRVRLLSTHTIAFAMIPVRDRSPVWLSTTHSMYGVCVTGTQREQSNLGVAIAF